MKSWIVCCLWTVAVFAEVGDNDKIINVQYTTDLQGFSVSGDHLVVYGNSGSAFAVYDQASSTWRRGPASTSPWLPLTFGSTMLFTRSGSASIDAFDTASATWSTLQFPAVPQDSVQGTVLGSHAYFYGFVSAQGRNFSSPTVYALESASSAGPGAWSNLTDPSIVTRGGGAVAAIGTRLLVAGGDQPWGGTADVYDTGSSQWTSHLLMQTYSPAYAFVAAGSVVLSTSPVTTAVGADVFDGSTRTWKFVYFPDGFSGASRKFPVSLGSSIAFLYVNGSAHIYDPGADTWTVDNFDVHGLIACKIDAQCPFFRPVVDSGTLYAVYQTVDGRKEVFIHPLPPDGPSVFDWKSIIRGLSPGQIAAVVLGAVGVLAAIVGIVVCVVVYRRRRRARSRFSRFYHRRYLDEDEESLLGYD